MMTPCESYIVRIYRRDRKHPEELVGVVEVVETGETKKFTTGDELSAVLSAVPKGKKRRKKTGAAG